jgi:signal transduction histidine kinase
LRQVIRNLLSNAIKYTPDGGQITCECQEQSHKRTASLRDGATANEWPGAANLPDGRWAAVRVIDTGIGISPTNLPRLFERFYRVNEQGNIPGVGLGLAIAQELVALHNGHIAVASMPGQGSVFAFYVPLCAE